MNKQTLLAELIAHRGATPISVLVQTVVKDVQGAEFLKVNKVNGFIGWDYQNSVNNAQERNGDVRDFVAQARKWGQHISPSVIEHTKDGVVKHYLQIKVQSTGKPIYIDANGRVHGRIEQKERKTTHAENLGVILRDYSLDGIKAINWKGRKMQRVA